MYFVEIVCCWLLEGCFGVEIDEKGVVVIVFEVVYEVVGGFLDGGYVVKEVV